jgi:hypothetical protein
VNDGAAPRGPVLDDERFRRLAEYGEVEQAEAGRDLYASGDDSYDFFLLLTTTMDIVRDARVAGAGERGGRAARTTGPESPPPPAHDGPGAGASTRVRGSTGATWGTSAGRRA